MYHLYDFIFNRGSEIQIEIILILNTYVASFELALFGHEFEFIKFNFLQKGFL